MYFEYYINSIDDKDIEIKANIETLINNTNINNVISTYHQAKYIKKNFPSLKVGMFIDYPICNYETEYRHMSVLNAAKNNINYIAITIPTYYLINRKYDKIKDETKRNLDAAGTNTEVRYILEYRKFEHPLLAKACDLLLSVGINTIYSASGFFLDAIEDNITACTYLHKKTGINTIINGNVWTPQHIKQVHESGLYGFSSNNIFALKGL
jgi:deoxyribose-phosphate aldolase